MEINVSDNIEMNHSDEIFMDIINFFFGSNLGHVAKMGSVIMFYIALRQYNFTNSDELDNNSDTFS